MIDGYIYWDINLSHYEYEGSFPFICFIDGGYNHLPKIYDQRDGLCCASA